MPLLKKVRQLAAKTETTIGTDASLGNSDVAFNAWDIMIQPNIDRAQREAQSDFGQISGVPGQYIGTATFKTDMGWDGTATEPSWADILLPACGWVKSGQVFTPRAEAPGSNVKTVTIASYQNGKIRKLTGAMGTFKVQLVSGKMAFIEWEFKGAYTAIADGSMLTQTAPTASPLRFASASACSFNSIALEVESITIDAGNVMAAVEDPTTAAGVRHFLVTDRVPKITCNPEAILNSSQNRESIWLEGTEYAFALTMDGPTNSTLAFDAPKAELIALQEGDRNGMITDELEFQCNKNGNTNNASLSITFTAST
jgi:hypothetical protein